VYTAVVQKPLALAPRTTLYRALATRAIYHPVHSPEYPSAATRDLSEIMQETIQPYLGPGREDSEV